MPQIDTSQVGFELGRIRRSRGVNGDVVARRMGVDKSTVSKIESGSRRVDVSEFVTFADALGLQAGDLLPHTEGVPLRMRALVQMLDGRTDADIQRVMKVAAAMLDIEPSENQADASRSTVVENALQGNGVRQNGSLSKTLLTGGMIDAADDTDEDSKPNGRPVGSRPRGEGHR